MEEIIRNLDYKGLESMWKVTFPNESIDDFMLSFDYTDEEDYLKEIRQVLIDEIQDREVMRQTEQKVLKIKCMIKLKDAVWICRKIRQILRFT